MNFGTVREAEGQMDGQYQIKVAMFGTPQNVEGVTFTPQGKKVQQVTIADDLMEVQRVKIYGGKMTIGNCGQRLSFEIAPYTSDKNNQTYYSGFWNDRVGVSQATQGQQAPAQQPNAPKPTPSNKDRLIVAQVVYKAVCEQFCHSGDIGAFDVWLMGHLNVYNRHIDTIMQAGAGTLIAPPEEQHS